MKRIYLFITVLCFALALNAQDQQKPQKKLFLGCQFSFGGFFPSDVNDYLENRYANANMEFGTTDVFMNFSFTPTALYKISKMFGVQVGSDFTMAPKSVTLNGNSEFYNFSRISPWASANLYLGHFCLAGKGMYNIMDFEDYSVSSLGWNITASLWFKAGILRLGPFLAFDYAKGTASNNFELNYTGGRLGVEVLFGVK